MQSVVIQTDMIVSKIRSIVTIWEEPEEMAEQNF